ncbi:MULTISPECIES: alpha/beta hydrolase [unclassified Microbulbifer]|uniref:alpha/beta hydrolase family protein n=1 Tax=unclassified Microbulbifer TaxID=2619833 RepID=UPI0027E4A821|nr:MULTISPECIES: alpha/beta hydrolase [unclassified Microbulbifer]
MGRRHKVTFPGGSGARLAGILEVPAKGPPRATVLFAHCFTCGKDVLAASRIARRLAELGYAVLRFDFTGLGDSEGDFADTNFSSNVADLLAAAEFLRREQRPPELLLGHSLGGAAVLAAAGAIPEARAIATIAAPADAEHVTRQFADSVDTILREGQAEVQLGGRPFVIRKQFLDDLQRRRSGHIRNLDRPLLIYHSPLDNMVSVGEAAEIYNRAMHPKSFISLDDADHLLTRQKDADYIADTLAAWAGRYLPQRGTTE